MVALGQRHPYQTSAKIISNFVTSLVGALVYVTDCRMVDVDEFTELWWPLDNVTLIKQARKLFPTLSLV